MKPRHWESDVPCAAPGCDRLAIVRGTYCSGHYARPPEKRHGPLRPYRSQPYQLVVRTVEQLQAVSSEDDEAARRLEKRLRVALTRLASARKVSK